MANEDSLEVTLLVACDDEAQLEQARRVLLLSEGIGAAEIIEGSGGGEVSLTISYDPGQTTPQQAIDVLKNHGCQVLSELEVPAEGTGGIELAGEVDLFGHPVVDETR